MAVSAKVGSFNIGTGAAATTVVLSSFGFQPKAILFWWTGLTAANNGTRTSSLKGMGWAASASLFSCVTTSDSDGLGTSAAVKGFRTDSCISHLSDLGDYTAGTSVGAGWADLQSFDADGFTLEILDAFGVDLLVSYLAVGGTSITDAECGVFTTTGVAPANQTVSNVGNFQPSITFLMAVGTTSNAPTFSADAEISFGAATSSSDEHAHMSGANNSATTGATGSYNLAGEIFANNLSAPQTAPTDRMEFVSHNAGPGGFTVNHLERTNNQRVLWLSIKGGDWAVGDFLTQTDTVTAMTVSGLASEPAAVLVVSAGNAQTVADATPAAHDKWSVGAATSSTERAVQYGDSRNGNTNMFVHLAARSDALYVNSDPAQTAFTTTGLGDLTSIDSNGFSLIMDDADPAQAFAWYVAVGPAAAGAATTWPGYQSPFGWR